MRNVFALLKTSVWIACASLAAATAAAPSPARAAEDKVMVVRSAEAAVVREITDGFRSAFPDTAFEDVFLSDARSEAALGKRLEGASVILSIGVKAAAAVAKVKPAGHTIAVVPPAQADPAALGPTMRLQPPIDGLISAIPWMGNRFLRIGIVVEATAGERQKIAEVEAAKRGLALTVRTAKDARDVVTAVSELVAKNDLVVVDVSEGLQSSDVQFLLRTAQDAKIPLVGTSEGFVKAGAPAAITIDPKVVGAEAGKLGRERAAGMFDPRRFRVLVNLVVMERLGVVVPRERGTVENNILAVDTDIEDLSSAARSVTVTKPGVTKRGNLKFPEIARRNNIRSGDVVLEIEVRADGTIGSTKVLKGDPLFATAAVDSIKSWKFKPATRDGAPVDDTLRLNLKFQL